MTPPPGMRELSERAGRGDEEAFKRLAKMLTESLYRDLVQGRVSTAEEKAWAVLDDLIRQIRSREFELPPDWSAVGVEKQEMGYVLFCTITSTGVKESSWIQDLPKTCNEVKDAADIIRHVCGLKASRASGDMDAALYHMFELATYLAKLGIHQLGYIRWLGEATAKGHKALEAINQDRARVRSEITVEWILKKHLEAVAGGAPRNITGYQEEAQRELEIGRTTVKDHCKKHGLHKATLDALAAQLKANGTIPGRRS